MQFCPLCKSELVHRVYADMERLLCPTDTCEYVFWDNPIPVIGVIVEHENDIILANNVSWPIDWYSIITGFLEKGETPEEGVVREVKEELNLDVEKQSFVGIYSFFRLNQLIVAYHAIASGDIKLNEELSKYRRIKKEDLRPWQSETGRAVRDWLKQAGFPEKEDIPFSLRKALDE